MWEPMKVWLVNQYAIPPSQAGPTRAFMLARELLKRGHEVAIIASSFDHVTRKETRLRPGENWQVEEVEGVKFLWLRSPPYPGNTMARTWNMAVFAMRLLAGVGCKAIGKPDVIIGSSPHLFGAFAAERMAARLKAPFVLEVRDLWPQSLIDLGNKSENNPMVWGLRLIERHLYGRAKRIVAVLPGMVEYISARGPARESICHVPNGVEVDALPMPTPPRPREDFVCMYAGAHGLANGLDTVLDAAAILVSDAESRHIRFEFVGDGPAKAHLQRRVVKEGLRNVVFRDPVPKSKMHATLQDADCFVFTLRNAELFRYGISPNKLFDYLAAGRPVVFSCTTEYDPVARADAGVSVPAEDPAAITSAVKHIAGLPPDERVRLGANARRYVDEHHDVRSLARDFEHVLLQAIES